MLEYFKEQKPQILEEFIAGKKNTKTLVEMLILQFSEDNLRGTAKFISLKNYHRREERKKYQINHIGFILFFVLRFALFFKMS